MKAFLYSLYLQLRLDIRNRQVLVTYYVVPLVFFLFMGGIFTSVLPTATETLVQSMAVFGITMGAVLGASASLLELLQPETRKAYRVGRVPLWSVALSNGLSAFIHLLVMSLVITFLAPLLFRAVPPANLAAHFLGLALFTAANLSLGTLLALLIKESGRLTMASQLVFLPSTMLSGIMFPAEMLPKALALVGNAFPATWGFRLLTAGNFPAAYWAPLLFSSLVFIVASAWRMAHLGD